MCNLQWLRVIIDAVQYEAHTIMELLHFVITQFSPFYFWGLVDNQAFYLMPLATHTVSDGHSDVGN